MTVAEVFIDAGLAAEDGGESGATLPSGVKVGPNTLAEILCGGKVRVIAADGLHPVAYTDRTDVIPPAVRRFVQWRDMGQCSIEGCHSRYRIQPHHIHERHRGGNHDPDNWSACAGTTTTSPSTNSATPSTPTHPPTADGCSPPANPPGHPSATATRTRHHRHRRHSRSTSRARAETRIAEQPTGCRSAEPVPNHQAPIAGSPESSSVSVMTGSSARATTAGYSSAMRSTITCRRRTSSITSAAAT